MGEASRKIRDRIDDIHSMKLPASIAKLRFINRALPFLGDVAQVPSSPENITRISLNSAMTCLRLCGNSTTYNTDVAVIAIGAPGFPDVVAFLNSTRRRAGAETLHGFEERHKIRSDSAREAFSSLLIGISM